MQGGHDREGLTGDALAAFAIAALLAFAWAWRDWANLSALRLPDTDDMMRLQQIRDWTGGQGFADVSQHRLGAPPGLAMHWSRLPDLVPGAMIALLSPVLGPAAAALCAVIAWPALLFAAALLLVGRIARALGGAPIARTAIIVSAIAFPATTVFLPGRIDHHGLQIVLLLAIMRVTVAEASAARGVIAGVAAALGLMIGLETAPLIAALGLVMAAAWLCGAARADERLMGLGIGLGAVLFAGSIWFATEGWDYPGCDGFTRLFWRVAQCAALAPICLALGGRWIAGPRARAALGLSVGGVLAGGTAWGAPMCLAPYGGVDPLLARLWLAHVGEAQGMLAAPLSVAVGYSGVMLAGVAAGAWLAVRDRRWAGLLAVQLAALLLAFFQLRGAYAGAMLAAPALAAVVAAARRRGSIALFGSWIASAGMLYPLAASALVPDGVSEAGGGGAGVRAAGPEGGCTAPAALGMLAAVPPGRLIAPLDLGAYALAATRLSVVGAPYHRNNAGNLATYRFFLGTPAAAAGIARAWQVDYVAWCDGAFAELGPAAAQGGRAMAAKLAAGAPPPWLEPIGRPAHGLHLFRVIPGLSPAVPAR